MRLLARTTRSVAATEAGAELLARLGPAFDEITGALTNLAGRRNTPAGRVRLVVSPAAATMVVGPKLAEFARRYPAVVLDVTTTNLMHLDIVAGRFDAGIHLSCTTRAGGSNPRRCPLIETLRLSL